MVFIDDDSSWEKHDNQKIVGWNYDCWVNAKRLDRHHRTENIGQKCDSCCTGRNCYGSDGPFPSITHPFLAVPIVDSDKLTLTPGINENKYIVCCYPENDEYDQVMQVRQKSYPENALVNDRGECKGKDN